MALRTRLGLLTTLAFAASTFFIGRAAAADETVVVAADDDDDDGVVTVEIDDDDDVELDDDEEIVEVTEVIREDEERVWGGLRFGTIITPYKVLGPSRPSKRVTSNQARACLDPSRSKHCGNVRGFDLRATIFEARGRGDYPRAVGYFRSGFTSGRLDFTPSSEERGYETGDARALSYYTVPLFFGGNIYFLKDLPIRPYGGLGFGFDVLKMQYARHEARPLVDASARIGFELHAGVEARITNYVSLSAEVMQLWSARRKLAGVPDFSNEGLTFLAGVTLSIPTKRKHHHKTVKRTRTVRRKKAPTKPAAAKPVAPANPVPAAVAPVDAAPAAAPPAEVAAPVSAAPTPAPVAAPAAAPAAAPEAAPAAAAAPAPAPAA